MKKIMISLLIIVLIPLVLILIFVPVRFGNGTAKVKDKNKIGLVIAHRGASGVAPENTMPAIDSALVSKADYIEIDVHLSKDNRVVVMHDYSVDRTTNGEGLISELDSDYIKTLDAGSWYGNEFAKTKVPFLEDIIEQVNGKAKLLIEIKEKKDTDTGIEKEVVRILKKYNAIEWCIVQSFNDESLERVNKALPQVELHKLFFFKFRFLPYIFDENFTRFSYKKYKHVSAFNMYKGLTPNSLIREIKLKGKKVNAWGCGKKGSCKPEEMYNWDGIITNFPGDYNNQ